jgi:DNA-binding PadR family transcriptional regulator
VLDLPLAIDIDHDLDGIVERGPDDCARGAQSIVELQTPGEYILANCCMDHGCAARQSCRMPAVAPSSLRPQRARSKIGYSGGTEIARLLPPVMNRSARFQSRSKRRDTRFGLAARGDRSEEVKPSKFGIMIRDMPPRAPLGEFEVVVLLAVLHLRRNAFGSAIRDGIERRSGRAVSRGSVYITLDRLEDKGLLRSALADGSDSRGGRPKRFYRLTANGLKSVRHSLALLARMQKGLRPILSEA